MGKFNANKKVNAASVYGETGEVRRAYRNRTAKPKPVPNVPDDAKMLCDFLVNDIYDFLDYTGDDYRERDKALFNNLNKRITNDMFVDEQADDYIVQTLERFVRTDRETHALQTASITFVVWDVVSVMPAYYGKAFLNKYGVGSVTVTPFNFYGYAKNIDRASWNNRPARNADAEKVTPASMTSTVHTKHEAESTPDAEVCGNGTECCGDAEPTTNKETETVSIP